MLGENIVDNVVEDSKGFASAFCVSVCVLVLGLFLSARSNHPCLVCVSWFVIWHRRGVLFDFFVVSLFVSELVLFSN